MRKIIIICLAGIISITAMAGCGKKERTKTKEESVPVRVMKVDLQTLCDQLEYVGNIDQDEITVYPKVSGKIIEKAKDEGNPVAKGEAIAYIDRDEIGLKFEKAPVESPLTGVVGRVYVDIGTNVTPQTPIALVASGVVVEIELNIPGKYLPRLSLGQKAKISVDSYPGREFMAKITKISPIVDVDTRAAPIVLTIDDPEHLLKSGMFAKVKLILMEHRDIPAILKEAIMGKAPDTYVYTVQGKRAHMQKVTLGIREGPYFEVTEGVNEGDLVVIMGQQRLRDGSPVIAEE